LFKERVWLANQQVSVYNQNSYAAFVCASLGGLKFSPNYDESVSSSTFLTPGYRLGLGTNVPQERLDVVGSVVVRTNFVVLGTWGSNIVAGVTNILSGLQSNTNGFEHAGTLWKSNGYLCVWAP
jgi:hypothetical protein